MTPFTFICPQTGQPLQQVSDDTLANADGTICYRRIEGVWHMLPPDRVKHFQQFIEDYEHIRSSEGRGAPSADWYRSLPFPAENTPFYGDWLIRAHSYTTLLDLISGKQQHTLDLGGGNGWLSNRLTEHGHCVATVDLLTNTFDGLGAHQHYQTSFTTVQAEYDHLPFEADQFDVVIFNGSLHYAENYTNTLNEARRVLHERGRIIVMDSPVYKNAHSGQQMVKEREDHFEQTYGTRSDALDSEHYLTYSRLDTLEAQLGITWQILTPNYGLRWGLRPLKARLRGHREPAKFHVIVGQFI